METKSLPLRIRHAIDGDIPFIFNSWLKSFRETGYFVQHVPHTIFYANHHKLVQKLVQRSSTFVACNPDDTSQIYGYIVGEYIEGTFVLHFIYIKHAFRKLGVGKELYNSFSHTGAPTCCTHLNRWAEKFLLKYNMLYHPYLAFMEPGTVAADEVVSE